MTVTAGSCWSRLTAPICRRMVAVVSTKAVPRFVVITIMTGVNTTNQREKRGQLHFRNYEELLSYCKKRFKTWGR